MTVPDHLIEEAATAIRAGELVVYPTETVYGLGADALDRDAVERVFALKHRSREDPISMAVPTVDAALDYVRVSDVERRFMQAFLPGPVTVVCRKRDGVPDALTGGRARVGVRVPDNDVALELLERVAPITATSANRSGAGSVRRVKDLAAEVRNGVTTVIDAGPTPGSESTVVDVAAGDIIRSGAMADAIDTWLSEEQR